MTAQRLQRLQRLQGEAEDAEKAARRARGRLRVAVRDAVRDGASGPEVAQALSISRERVRQLAQ